MLVCENKRETLHREDSVKARASLMVLTSVEQDGRKAGTVSLPFWCTGSSQIPFGCLSAL